MRWIHHTVVELAKTNAPIFLVAESGVGKRALALEIHRLSGRKVFTELKANEFALLAGRKGTERLSTRTVYAHGVSGLSAEDQFTLWQLAFAESTNGDGLGTRWVASSESNLDELVRRQRFREDLFYRLGGVCLHLPPLRQR